MARDLEEAALHTSSDYSTSTNNTNCATATAANLIITTTNNTTSSTSTTTTTTATARRPSESITGAQHLHNSHSSHMELIAAPPASSGLNHLSLPLLKSHIAPAKPEPILMHRSLHRVPLQVRYGCTGFLNNVLFMVVYNTAVAYLEAQYAASTIYAVVSTLFIPIGHATNSILCFGWPRKRYLKSLLSNFPIYLTAIVMGSALTAYLDRVDFNAKAETYLRSSNSMPLSPTSLAAALFHVTPLSSSSSSSPPHQQLIQQQQQQIHQQYQQQGHLLNSPASAAIAIPTNVATMEEKGEFFSSLLVLFVTGIWTYILSVLVNTPPERSEKKEL